MRVTEHTVYGRVQDFFAFRVLELLEHAFLESFRGGYYLLSMLW